MLLAPLVVKNVKEKYTLKRIVNEIELSGD